MAKIVLQNQASPATPECGFTAMYINCNTCLPTFKLDDWSEAIFVTSQSLCDLMDSNIYDSHWCKTDVFDYINCAIWQVSSLKLCPVDVLPQAWETWVIYMIPNWCWWCNTRDEYLYVNWQYELIWSTWIDTSDLAKCCDIPTDNCQLCNSRGYTTCTWDMQKCMYDPDNKATNVYNMDNMDDGTCKVAMTTTERTKLSNISWVNTWDETTASIKCKLWISTLSWCNTWDETNSTIKCKLWAASCADDWYLKACDFASFINKQNQLVSWENIITINGCTILRCGDICVENLGWDMKACVYDPYGCCTDMFNRANHYWCMSYACVTWLWSAATRDIWTNCWNVVVVQNDWKISSDVLPAQYVVDVCVFNDEASMLAWSTANRWDMAIRTDIARTYVMSGSCPSCIDSWTILPVPSSPVTSVNWCIGDVCLTTDNIDDSNSTKKYVSASEKACWCGKADPYVSWCTIKTINGCSVLGCWDICIPNTITCVNGKTGNVCLTADDISDTWTWHLFVSQTEKNRRNCKINCEDAIVDNCQIANGCWYTTCTWNISSWQILCIVYTCKACVPTVCVPATLYITCD